MFYPFPMAFASMACSYHRVGIQKQPLIVDAASESTDLPCMATYPVTGKGLNLNSQEIAVATPDRSISAFNMRRRKPIRWRRWSSIRLRLYCAVRSRDRRLGLLPPHGAPLPGADKKPRQSGAFSSKLRNYQNR
jgi:hypothetical protein